MHVYIGSDHGGFDKKEVLVSHLREKGHEVTDCGAYSSESTDYPDYALAVGKAVHQHPGQAMGVLLCRSGEGMEIAVNKIDGIRGALAWDVRVAQETRHDNDANVLVLPSDFIDMDATIAITDAFLATSFSNEERHVRRLEKIQRIEKFSHES